MVIIKLVIILCFHLLSAFIVGMSCICNIYMAKMDLSKPNKNPRKYLRKTGRLDCEG